MFTQPGMVDSLLSLSGLQSWHSCQLTTTNFGWYNNWSETYSYTMIYHLNEYCSTKLFGFLQWKRRNHGYMPTDNIETTDSKVMICILPQIFFIYLNLRTIIVWPKLVNYRLSFKIDRITALPYFYLKFNYCIKYYTKGLNTGLKTYQNQTISLPWDIPCWNIESIYKCLQLTSCTLPISLKVLHL